MIRDGCDLIGRRTGGGTGAGGGMGMGMQKFLVTGLSGYQMDGQTLARVVMAINTKVKFRKNTLFWHVEI